MSGIVAIVLHGGAMIGLVRADIDVVANIRLETGELRIANRGPTDFRLTGYQIDSPTSDLNVAGWLPISGRLDANGDMSFDPDGEWTIIAPMLPLPLTASQMFEGVFMGPGGLLAPHEAVYLGAVWVPDSPKKVAVQVTDDGPMSFSVDVNYLASGDYDENGNVDQQDYLLWKRSLGETGVGLLADGNVDHIVNLADYTIWRDNSIDFPPGDYDQNYVVDQADYALWKDTFNFKGVGLPADGNSDGVVGIADYAIWRDHLGTSAIPLGSVAVTSASVPQPSSGRISGIAAFWIIALRRWRRQRHQFDGQSAASTCSSTCLPTDCRPASSFVNRRFTVPLAPATAA